MTLFKKQIAGIFLDAGSGGTELLMYAVTCISFGLVLNALLYSRVSCFQAVGKTQKAQRLEAAANLAVPLLLALILSVPFGMYGIFAAFPVSKALVLVAEWVIFAVRTHKPFPSALDYLELDETFFPPETDIISYSFSTAAHCAAAGRQIYLFCKGHGLNRRIGYNSGLCADEIMTNIIQHGGGSGAGRSDLRVVVSDGKLIIRIRDGCKEFNLGMIHDMLSSSTGRFEKIGLKFIAASADEINYYRVYGMNTVIIKI